MCDENVDVRRRAIDELDLGPIPHRYALRHVLVTDDDAEARATAARKLGEVRIKRVILARIEATHVPLPSVRDQAFRALGRLGAKNIATLAIDAVRLESVGWVHHAAVQTLATLGADDVTVQDRVRHAEPLEHQRSADGATSTRLISFAFKNLDAVWNNKPVAESILMGSAPTSIPFVPKAFADEDSTVVTTRLEIARDANVPSRALVVWRGIPHAASAGLRHDSPARGVFHPYGLGTRAWFRRL